MAKQQRRQISPQDDTEEQADTVYKIVEVVGVSERMRAVTPWKRQPVRCATCAWPK